MDDLVESFHHVTSKEERLSTLRRLVQSLPVDEVAALTRIISDQHDPLWRLPVELALEISSHLHLLDAWRLQLVCRRWRAVLSSKRILDAALARWETDETCEATRRDETVVRRVRHMQATRLGVPFMAVFHKERIAGPFFYGMRRQRLSRAALEGTVLAYVRSPEDNHGEEIALRDLISGQCVTVVGEAREGIAAIALTNSLLAFVSFLGFLYISRLDGADLRTVRLPSSNIAALVANGDFVTVLMKASETGCNTVLLYSRPEGKLKSFSFACQTGDAVVLAPQNMLLDSIANTLDVFSSNLPDEAAILAGGRRSLKRGLHIGHMRLPLSDAGADGVLKPVSNTVISLESVFIEGNRPWRRVVGEIFPTGHAHLYRIQLSLLETRSGNILPLPGWDNNVFSVMFDSSRPRLYVEWHNPVAGDTRPEHLYSRSVRWKDTAYAFETLASFHTFCAMENLLPKRMRYRNTVKSPTAITDAERIEETSEITVLRNESFMVSFKAFPRRSQPEGLICVYSFDEDAQMVGCESTGLWDRDHSHVTPKGRFLLERKSGPTCKLPYT